MLNPNAACVFDCYNLMKLGFANRNSYIEDYPNLDFFGIKCYRVVIKWREEERVMEKEEVARVDGLREFRGFKI